MPLAARLDCKDKQNAKNGAMPVMGRGKIAEYVGDATRVDNIRAGGAYEIVGTAVAILRSTRTDFLAAKLTSWIIDQHRSGIARPSITSDVLKSIEGRRRLNIAEQIDRFFELLLFLDVRADFSLKNSGTVDEQFKRDNALLASWLECETDRELSSIVSLLIQSGLVNGQASGFLKLTPQGVARLTETQKKGTASRQAFIAMWFDSSMNDAATKGFELGISAAGYTPMRIDKKEHNNKIDDEIVAEIRRSKFVVADFTSELLDANGIKKAISRGGVYFEAGFALGLGLPVIWCCRSDLIDYVHFDTRQFAHVVWDTPKDLAEKLYNRICAVIGQTSDALGPALF